MCISERRKAVGYSSQEQFAKNVGTSRSTIAKWEAGITTPRIPTLKRAAVALGCTVDELLREPKTKKS